MNCQSLKQKYTELLELQKDFQTKNAEFQQMKSKTVAERRAVSDELQIKQATIETFINENFEDLLFVSVEKARNIMDKNLEVGKTHCFGPVEIEKAFGIKLDEKDIPEIQFSKQELERAEEMGKFLVLRVDVDDQGSSLTMKNLKEMMIRRGYPEELNKYGRQKGKVTIGENYGMEDFWLNDPIDLRWALVDKETLLNSNNKDYFQQSKVLKEHIIEIYKNQTIPDKYQEAIKEFNNYAKDNFANLSDDKINKIISGQDWKRHAIGLSELKLNALTRKTPAEELYDELMYFQINSERLNMKTYNLTKRRFSDGFLINVVNYGADGVRVYMQPPHTRDEEVGVSTSFS